jgi:hypothetical protein
MALIGSEGFDMYNGVGTSTGLQAKWLYQYPNFGSIDPSGCFSFTTGRFGGQALLLTPAPFPGRILYAAPGGATTQLSWGMAFLNTANNGLFAGGGVLGFMSAGVPVFSVAINAALGVTVNAVNGFEINKGNFNVTSTLGSSPSTGVSQIGNWQYLEICAQAGLAGAGAITVYLQGVGVLTLTGLTLSATFDTVVVMPGVFNIAFFQADGSYTIDDIYLATTNTPLGPIRVSTIRPSGAGASTQWSPLTGANWTQVSETLVDGNTSYVSSSTVGQSDLYGLNPLPITPPSILGVNVVIFAEATDANPRSIYNQIKSGLGSTVYTGTAITLSGGYFRYDRMLTQDPYSASAWTVTGVNGSQIGPNLAT